LSSESNQGLTCAITLYSGGLVISGDLISGVAFSNGIAEALERQAGEEPLTAEELGSLARMFRSQAKELVKTVRTEEAGPAQYIHLADATIFAGGHHHVPFGGYWRGRLSRIDSWSFGGYSEMEEEG
jgi:hypothetical protein